MSSQRIDVILQEAYLVCPLDAVLERIGYFHCCDLGTSPWPTNYHSAFPYLNNVFSVISVNIEKQNSIEVVPGFCRHPQKTGSMIILGTRSSLH